MQYYCCCYFLTPHSLTRNPSFFLLSPFIRYGKVQSVKILPARNGENACNATGNTVCATVAFIDIRSAAKAHTGDNKIDERILKTDYYEPPASSTATSAIYIHETREDALLVHRQQTGTNNLPYGTSSVGARAQRRTPSRVG